MTGHVLARAGRFLLARLHAQRLRHRRLGRRLDTEERRHLREQGRQSHDGGAQIVADHGGNAARLHVRADGREGGGLEHGDPAIGGIVRGEGGVGELAELRPERRRERHPGLRRQRRQLEGAHHPTDLGGALDVGEPELELFLLLGDEGRLELGGELSRRLVAHHHRIVGRHHHAAQVTQVEVGELALGGLGTVEPLGHAQRGIRSSAIFSTVASGIVGRSSAARRALSSRMR